MACRSIHIPPDYNIHIDSMVKCEPLVPIPNGHVRYESVDRTTIQPGDMVTYSCDVPYALEGDTYRVCISNGSWSGEEPTCTGVYRLMPPLIKANIDRLKLKCIIIRVNFISYSACRDTSSRSEKDIRYIPLHYDMHGCLINVNCSLDAII